MDEQDGAFFDEPEEEEVREIVQVEEIIPANNKSFSEEPRNITLKMVPIPKVQHQSAYVPFKINARQESSDSSQQNDEFRFDSPFTQFYNKDQLVYQRYNNQKFNKINSIVYFGGVFIPRQLVQELAKQTSSSIPELLSEQFDLKEDELPQINIDPDDKSQLIFDSDFQSGNLFAVFKISEKQYDLVMQNDTNACGNNQWFYFSIRNMLVGVDYTLNVVNFTKNDSLFNYGMLPVAYSHLSNKKNNLGWHKIGREVIYKKGQIPRENSRRHYYKLSFKFKWMIANDKVYIASSFPYTYTKLQQKIQTVTTKYKDIATKMSIGKTLTKKNIQVIVISPNRNNKKKDPRKAIVFMARQHPGETQGSYVCDGVIDKLLGKSKEAEFIRKNYIVYIIPMINPDGVIFGHYRTNFAGKDLNRKWDSTEKELNCPEVTAIKSFLTEVSKEREIRFIIDLHGHSKKLNSFFYGNPNPDNPELVRIFPYICSKLHPAVQFYDCTFSAQEYKRKAARIYLSYLFKQLQVYTYESSFYGYFKDGKKEEFSTKSYENLGETLVNALAIVLEQQDGKGSDTKNSIYNKAIFELKTNKNLLEVGNKMQSGSESKPEEGELNQKDIPKVQMTPKIPPTPKIQKLESQKKAQKRSGSRKGIREIKEINKPVRNLRCLEISRVNSILPDRYQLGLQPIRKKQPDSSLISRTQTSILRVNSSCQTDNKEPLEEYREKDIEEFPNSSNSLKIEHKMSAKRYSSVIKNTAKHNNIIFRIDFNNQRSSSASVIKEKTISNAFSQTIITFKYPKAQRNRSSQLFPSVESPDTERRLIMTHQIKYDQTKHTKRQTELFLNGMVKKYLMDKDLKLRDQQRNTYERPLSIRKKQIYNKK